MTDALIRFLNERGYQPVLLPRTGLVPPDLYGVDNHRNLTRYGPLNHHLEHTISDEPDQSQIPDIEHVETTRKSLKKATTFLNDALQCIGLPAAPSLNASLVRSTGLRFLLTGVIAKGIPPTKLFTTVGTFREGGIPKEVIKDGKLHIAYTYLYANTLIMQTADGTVFDVNAAVDWSNVLTADGRVAVERIGGTKLSFARADGEPVAFAYQAGQLTRGDGQWEFYPGVLRRVDKGEPETAVPYIPFRGICLKLKEDLSPKQVAAGGK